MPRVKKTPEQRLQELETQKAQIAARIKSEASKIRTAERKRDPRRKVIAGALALEHMAVDAAFGKALKSLLNQHVTRPDDRALFGLSPSEK